MILAHLAEVIHTDDATMFVIGSMIIMGFLTLGNMLGGGGKKKKRG